MPQVTSGRVERTKPEKTKPVEKDIEKRLQAKQKFFRELAAAAWKQEVKILDGSKATVSFWSISAVR